MQEGGPCQNLFRAINGWAVLPRHGEAPSFRRWPRKPVGDHDQFGI